MKAGKAVKIGSALTARPWSGFRAARVRNPSRGSGRHWSQAASLLPSFIATRACGTPNLPAATKAENSAEFANDQIRPPSADNVQHFWQGCAREKIREKTARDRLGDFRAPCGINALHDLPELLFCRTVKQAAVNASLPHGLKRTRVHRKKHFMPSSAQCPSERQQRTEVTEIPGRRKKNPHLAA